jgi:hypothetical protein
MDLALRRSYIRQKPITIQTLPVNGEIQARQQLGQGLSSGVPNTPIIIHYKLKDNIKCLVLNPPMRPAYNDSDSMEKRLVLLRAKA